MEYAVELFHITKKFGNVVANDNVTVLVKNAEIHGLLGENGAGKSTIMNILYGMYQNDEGTIKIFEKETSIGNPQVAIKHGIGMIHQHFMLMPNETVLRNIILGAAPKKGFIIDEKKAVDKLNSIMQQYGIHVPLKEVVNNISVGEKQRVEILKALYRDVKILILDEPTAVLTPSETDALLDTMRKLKEKGTTIIFITHKLKEVLAVTDSFTVMRRGVVTGVGLTKDTDVRALSEMIVGRAVDFTTNLDEYSPGDEILSLKNVCTKYRVGKMPVKNINFSIRKGEIVGIAGVEGNGQSDLVEAISGIVQIEEGTITLNNAEIQKLNIRKRRLSGLSHIPEDRLKTGASKECTISENLMLNKYFQAPFSDKGILNHKKIRAYSDDLCDKFFVKTPDSTYAIGTLSGGNMQKVVFAREFDCQPSLMIASQPTRGVDIGATKYIHNKIAELRNEGKGVLLVSAELDEVMALSDRILVMYEGEIVAEFARNAADEYEIGEYMLGAKKQGGRHDEH